MESLRKLALAATLMPLTCLASTIDPYGILARAQMDETGYTLAATEQETRTVLSRLLVTPSSLYSDRVPDDQVTWTNEAWWPAFLESYQDKTQHSADEALLQIARQLGLTKAIPGIDVDVSPQDIENYSPLGRTIPSEAVANARKAAIDPDIFWKARDINGRMTTTAAAQAVALQTLREVSHTMSAEELAANDFEPDVLERVMAAQGPDDIAEYDDRYLMQLSEYLIGESGMFVASGGAVRLPSAYRIARTAAAYSDADGYFGSYCEGNAPRPGIPTDHTALEDEAPLCFIAATDRSVQLWYGRKTRLEASGIRLHENHHTGATSLLRWVGSILAVVDFVGFVEDTVALTANEVVQTGGISEADAEAADMRAEMLTCRIRNI